MLNDPLLQRDVEKNNDVEVGDDEFMVLLSVTRALGDSMAS